MLLFKKIHTHCLALIFAGAEMSIRVKLDLKAFGRQKPEWMLVDPVKTPTFCELASQISAKKGISSNLEIQLDGCLLPEEESVVILQSGDIVTVCKGEGSPPPSKKAKLDTPSKGWFCLMCQSCTKDHL